MNLGMVCKEQWTILPAKMELRDVDWRFFNAQSNTWFALDNENYLKLSKNMVDMAEYLQKLRIVIQTYETNRVELSE